ncbi:MAG: LamG domain-containing protein [Planctomycetota bacterium]|nr:MAG: LamG domain-containing protein [Planctomycetota bacterium]
MARENQNFGDQLTISNPSELQNLDPFTFACWLYMKNPYGISATYPRIYETDDSADNVARNLFFNNQSKLCLQVKRNTTNAIAVSNANPVSYTIWTHVLATFDSTDVPRMYLNGAEISYSSQTGGSGTLKTESGGDLAFMNSVVINSTLNGRMAEVGFWNRLLSSAERTNLAANKWSPMLIPSGLVGAWRLLGDDSPEPDSVYGNNAAVTGSIKADHPPGIVTSLGKPSSALVPGLVGKLWS